MWRLPGEFEKHSATWMAWPCRESIWPDMDATRRAYANVVNAISEGERVNLLVLPEHLAQAKKRCSHLNVEFIVAPIDDSWVRDTLPFFVTNENQLGAVNWNFNAWGEKFFPHDKDSSLGAFVVAQLNIQNAFEPGVVLEGGAVHSNGEGLLLATKQAVLNVNRNPGMKQELMRAHLEKYLSVNTIVWLKLGMIEDLDTDGHVDMVACFADANTVLMQSFKEDNLNHQNYLQNKAAIENIAQVISIDQPDTVKCDGVPMALSYVNSYIANHAVIIPSFNQKQADSAAYAKYEEAFPERDIIQISALDIFAGGGGIHCITMQQPEVLV